MNKDYYLEINKALQSYEDFKPWHDKTLDWIASRIDGAWKWRKITQSQMEELTDRICKILELGT